MKKIALRTGQDLDNLHQDLDHLPSLSVAMYVVLDLCSTDQTQETCARPFRSSGSHLAISSIELTDHEDQGFVCPERHGSYR